MAKVTNEGIEVYPEFSEGINGDQQIPPWKLAEMQNDDPSIDREVKTDIKAKMLLARDLHEMR